MNPLFLMLLLSSCIAAAYTRSALCGRNGGMPCPPGKREQLMSPTGDRGREDDVYEPLQSFVPLIERRDARPKLKRMFFN